ncbi:MAG: hypothetical protein JWQ97_2127 [Phenylobacterium sp.]|nr:hypothetical protein [Phenylobacterium sp.]
MSGILFLLDVIAFLVVVSWAYANDGASQSGAKGLLGMKMRCLAQKPSRARAAPRWRRANVYGAAQARPEAPQAPVAPTPGWRRTLRYDRRPPEA